MGFEGAEDALQRASDLLRSTEPYSASMLETELRALGEELGFVGAEVLWRPAGRRLPDEKPRPPLFDMMEVLGRDVCIRRIDSALELLREVRTSA